VSKQTLVLLLIAAALIFLGSFAFLHSGSFLVVSHPEKSDVIVVLAGDHNDRRFWRGVELLREGYGQHMQLDAPSARIYGNTYAEQASTFIAHTAGIEQSKIVICRITNDSTVEESSDVRLCLGQLQTPPHSVLLVTSDFHTRRALSIFRSRLPQYRWSAAAVYDPTVFGDSWWHRREWAKTCVLEWQKLLWWELVESWRR
jgi:uncharacterized SAM-binding protein YcdF (DUF218 family)